MPSRLNLLTKKSYGECDDECAKDALTTLYSQLRPNTQYIILEIFYDGWESILVPLDIFIFSTF
jgi:hypothetical protein